jgi:hypothetical protein
MKNRRPEEQKNRRTEDQKNRRSEDQKNRRSEEKRNLDSSFHEQKFLETMPLQEKFVEYL